MDAHDNAGQPPERWALYEQHARAIQRYAARRVEPDAIDDVVAETFAIAWRRLPRDGDPLPWLYGVARRVVHGHRRSHSRRKALLLRFASQRGGGASAPDPAELIVGDTRVAQAFAALTPIEREALRLHVWEELADADAARAAGCSTGTFAVRLSRAKARLAAGLERSDAPKSAAEPTDMNLTTLEVCHDS